MKFMFQPLAQFLPNSKPKLMKWKNFRLPENHPSYGADFDGKTLFSTTGSLDSDFAKMVETHCFKYENIFHDYPNHTFLFEICDPSDVHIIRENFGKTLIGVVEVATT